MEWFKTQIFDSSTHMIIFVVVLGLAAWAIWWFIGQFVSIALDVGRFSPRRIWAISTVSFQESIRRRVLWITPLAIVGIVVISQLQHPSDEQDALRQTIKYSIFAAGLVVVLATLILACTNLPKEIESRVIYTIVTKPTTRLEIIVGKIIGFARVSATLLLIMGLFTFVYVEIREKVIEAAAEQRLANMSGVDPDRPLLEHYVNNGLLHACAYALVKPEVRNVFPPPGAPDVVGVEMFAGSSDTDTPQAQEKVRWMEGDEAGFLRVPYDLGGEVLPPGGTEDLPGVPEAGPLLIRAHVPFRMIVGRERWHPSPVLGQYLGSPKLEFIFTHNPKAEFHIFDANGDTILQGADFQWGNIEGGLPMKSSTVELEDPSGQTAVDLVLPVASVDKLRNAPGDPHSAFKRIFISYAGIDREVHCQFGAYRGNIELYNLRLDPKAQHPLVQSGTIDGKAPWPVFEGFRGTHGGQMLHGSATAENAMVGVYHFDASALKNRGSTVQFEFKGHITRSSSESRTDRDDATMLSLQVYRRPHGNKPGKTFPAIVHAIESNRTAFIQVPAEQLGTGGFDVMVRCLTAGHYIGLRDTSLSMVRSEHGFALNLAKSMLILWGFSLLVITVSVFSSTFVSWPIAIVLSVMILTGRWGVDELADVMQPGYSRQVVSDIFGKGLDPAGAKVLGESMEDLRVLATSIAKVMPDISPFDATDNIERGVNIPSSVLTAAAGGLLLYALPMGLLAYLILKAREVAP